jgi:hypothetical protein
MRPLVQVVRGGAAPHGRADRSSPTRASAFRPDVGRTRQRRRRSAGKFLTGRRRCASRLLDSLRVSLRARAAMSRDAAGSVPLGGAFAVPPLRRPDYPRWVGASRARTPLTGQVAALGAPPHDRSPAGHGRLPPGRAAGTASPPRRERGCGPDLCWPRTLGPLLAGGGCGRPFRGARGRTHPPEASPGLTSAAQGPRPNRLDAQKVSRETLRRPRPATDLCQLGGTLRRERLRLRGWRPVLAPSSRTVGTPSRGPVSAAYRLPPWPIRASVADGGRFLEQTQGAVPLGLGSLGPPTHGPSPTLPPTILPAMASPLRARPLCWRCRSAGHAALPEMVIRVRSDAAEGGPVSPPRRPPLPTPRTRAGQRQRASARAEALCQSGRSQVLPAAPRSAISLAASR